MDNYIGILATIQDISQRSPETIGTAMNTILSRFSNIKAGKFVATQEDMASADYDEDSFENLNDIESVLDTVGIKLRENYGTYRDIQDVLQDIADIWNTISQTEQNALASAIAGELLPEHIEIYDNEFIKIGECLRLDNTEIIYNILL